MRKCIRGLSRSSRKFATCAQHSAFADVADREGADADDVQRPQTLRRSLTMKRVGGEGQGTITPYPSPLTPCYTASRVFNYDNQEFCSLACCGSCGRGPDVWRCAAGSRTCCACAGAGASARGACRAKPDVPHLRQP